MAQQILAKEGLVRKRIDPVRQYDDARAALLVPGFVVVHQLRSLAGDIFFPARHEIQESKLSQPLDVGQRIDEIGRYRVRPLLRLRLCGKQASRLLLGVPALRLLGLGQESVVADLTCTLPAFFFGGSHRPRRGSRQRGGRGHAQRILHEPDRLGRKDIALRIRRQRVSGHPPGFQPEREQVAAEDSAKAGCRREICGKILLKPAADLVGTEGRRLAPSVDKKHIKFLKEIPVIPGKAGEKSEIHGNGASGSPGLRLHRIEDSRKERQHQHHHKAEIHRDASFPCLHLFPPSPIRSHCSATRPCLRYSSRP